jgi:transglutaminase/protease-like cytokinesis protein 3
MRFDKELCDKIVSSLPKREKTNLSEFKKKLKSKTNDLTEIERAFVLFKWMGQNIDYDVKNKNAGKRVDCSKEAVFRTGKTVCSGYSRLYEDIAIYLNLEVLIGLLR